MYMFRRVTSEPERTASDVRVHVYRSFVERGRPPMPLETATALGLDLAAVETALRKLHDDDVIVLMPGTHFVWLAHPFSALAAPFEVRSNGARWDAICIWDGLGVLALLERDGSVTTSCPDCGERLEVVVTGGRVDSGTGGVVHFGVPAARWYEDVAHT